jgi:hypothetical protein
MTLLFAFVWPRIVLEIWLSAFTNPACASGVNSRTNNAGRKDAQPSPLKRFTRRSRPGQFRSPATNLSDARSVNSRTNS